MSSNLMREMSTSMIANSNCRCESCLNDSCELNAIDCKCDTYNKIIRKPFERNNNDYDIHTTFLDDNPHKYHQTSRNKIRDTFALFSLTNDCSNLVFNNKNCNCSECECINCEDEECKGKSIRGNKSAKLKYNKDSISFLRCKCLPCECHICSNTVGNNNSSKNILNISKSCGCDVCDCLTCSNIKDFSRNNLAIDNTLQCNHFINSDVDHFQFRKNNNVLISEKGNEDVTRDVSNENIYPLKKGILLTPSLFEANVLSVSQSRTDLKFNEYLIEQSKNDIKKSERDHKMLKSKLNEAKSHLNQIESKQNYVDAIHSLSIAQLKKLSSQSFFDNCLHIDKTSIHMNDSIQNENFISKKARNQRASADLLHKNFSTVNNNDINDYMQGERYKNKDIILTPSSKEDMNKIIKSNQNAVKDSLPNSLNDIDSIVNKLHENTDDTNVLVQSDETKPSTSFVYENAKLSIKEAKAYSAQLLEILDKYEKANKEFITTSQQNQHQSITKQTKDDNLLIEDRSKTYEGPYKPHKTDMGNIMSSKDRKSISNNNNVHKHHNYDNNSHLIMENHFNKANLIVELDNRQEQKDVENNKIYSRLVKRSISKAKKKKIAKPMKSNNNINTETKRYRGASHKDVIEGDVKVNNSRSQETYNKEHLKSIFEDRNENFDEQSNDNKTDDVKSWSITRKNLYLNYEPETKNKNVCAIPKLELDVKQAVKSISLQTAAAVSKLDLELKANIFSDSASQTLHKINMQIDKEIDCKLDPSMNEITSGLKYLMDLLLTKAIFESELVTSRCNITPKMPTVNAPASSCDDLKVNFLGLRKVSDHTVLVRWRMPRVITDVQGYELQVDGRAVQKILSPSKCMAVVTCLPNCDKLLLTIRTLVAPTLAIDHLPATTIVYSPRSSHKQKILL